MIDEDVAVIARPAFCLLCRSGQGIGRDGSTPVLKQWPGLVGLEKYELGTLVVTSVALNYERIRETNDSKKKILEEGCTKEKYSCFVRRLI